MIHSQKQETRDKVNKLLQQYKEYNEAVNESDKDRIGDEMTYADPIVWMMYKHEAYAESDHSINTLGELKEHSIDHGGICAKRFSFVVNFVREKHGVDLMDENKFSNDTPIHEFYDSEIMNKIVVDKEFINEWEKYEYFKDNGKVAKWQNYAV